MSTAASDDRRLGPGAASAVWPLVVLAAVAGACWAVTFERMRGMDAGPGTPLGSLGWFAVVWLTMMAAMMLPSLSPMAVAYSRGAARGRARSIAGTVVFAAGYLLPWAAFGLLAYALVEGVRSLDLGVLAWDRAGRYVAGWVILVTAIYELTAAKGMCLAHCRETRLLRRRPGAVGALRMGMEQGRFCVGCSGALMVVLFALGVMSITWMLAIAAVIAIEKLAPRPAVAVGLTAVTLLLLGFAVVLAPGSVPWLTVPASM
jgi:predicted metal-binding membrane protein